MNVMDVHLLAATVEMEDEDYVIREICLPTDAALRLTGSSQGTLRMLHQRGSRQPAETGKSCLRSDSEGIAEEGAQMDLVMNADGATPLYIVAAIGQFEVVKALLAVEGPQVDLAKNDGATPLYIARRSASKARKRSWRLCLRRAFR
eukprot:gene14505-biopygen14966